MTVLAPRWRVERAERVVSLFAPTARERRLRDLEESSR